jgi:excisionase family DNA binding protein
MPAPSANDFLDIAQLAGWINITERHIRRLVAERRVPHHKIGGLVRFRPTEIEQWLDGNGRGQQHGESA